MIKTENAWLMFGDCLERMKEVPDGSVDMILTDPPYGTVCGVADGDVSHGMKGKTSWDVKLNTSAMLEQCNRILRPNGALVLFAQDPYTSELITGAHGNLPFSYRYTWLKDHFANALIAKKAPVNYTEDVLVFFKKYEDKRGHPMQGVFKSELDRVGLSVSDVVDSLGTTHASHFFSQGKQFRVPNAEYLAGLQALGMCEGLTIDDIRSTQNEFINSFKMKHPVVFNLPHGAKYKPNVLEYRKDYSGHHPTQKPVALLSDLVETYTNKGGTVLDFTMGSGSTGVACVKTNRKFIGIELDPTYYGIACERVLTEPPALRYADDDDNLTEDEPE